MNNTTSYTHLDFLRHGEPLGGRKYRGQTDDPLSEKGWTEMRSAVGEARPWQAIVSSPLSRCRAFAEALAAELTVPLAMEDRLKEVAFGDWEGRTPSELKAEDPDVLFNFKRDPLGARPAGAEDLHAFQSRVAQAFDAMAEAYRGRQVLVVAHAGVIRMAICHVLGIPVGHAYRLQVGSAAMARFRVEEKPAGRLAQLLWLTPGQGRD
ncbi:MAG: histidine phosphatase family protein [Thiobacillus sp.]|nr:histidine phosphatase family protein [Thiobacillus sp.]